MSLPISLVTFFLGAIVIAQSAVVRAGPVLEEVVVTAQKREQGLADVPISISVIDDQFIEDRNLLTIQSISQFAPNVSVTEQVLGFSVVSIRGFSGGANRGFEQSVGRYVDGVFSGRTASNSDDLNDIQRVEILRGPQGTLFGNNTIAGAMNIITKPANGENFEGDITVSGGSDNFFSARGSVSGPISKTLAFRVSLGHRQQDGFLYNEAHILGEADENMGNLEKDLWRVKLDWHPTETFSMVLASSGQNASSNMGYGSESFLGRPAGDLQVQVGPISVDALPVMESLVPGIQFDIADGKVAHNANTQFDLASRLHSLTVSWDIGEHQLKSITGYGTYEDDQFFDADFSPVDVLGRTSEESYRQTSQELQWISAQNRRFDYVVGLFWFNTSLDIESTLDADFSGYELPVSALDIKQFKQDYTSAAIYGQASYQISARWSATLGLRYTRDHKSADITHGYQDCLFFAPVDNSSCGETLGTGEAFSLSPELDESNVSPMASVSYEFTDQWSSYIRAAQGYKSGGFSAEDFYIGNNSNEFEPEEAITYEGGIKGSFLNGAGFLSAAIFYTEFDNLQVSLFNGAGFSVGNAAQATSKGFEMDARWLVSKAFSLTGSLGYTDAKYDKYPTAPCTVEQIAATTGDCNQDLKGQTLPRAPKWNASGSALYSIPWLESLEWQLGLDLIYSDSYYTDVDLDENTYQAAYTLVNARIALGALNQRWQVNLRGSNLTDETVMTGTVDLPFVPGAYGGRILPPRSYFIDLKARF